MAHVITAEGKIVEGTSLTDEEAKILDAIKTSMDGSPHYISSRAAASFAQHLIATYRITYRKDEAPAPLKVEPLAYPILSIPAPLPPGPATCSESAHTPHLPTRNAPGKR